MKQSVSHRPLVKKIIVNETWGPVYWETVLLKTWRAFEWHIILPFYVFMLLKCDLLSIPFLSKVFQDSHK